MGDHDHGIYTGRTLIAASKHLSGPETKNLRITAWTTGENDTRTRCIPLFASVVRCAARMPGTVCVGGPVPAFFRVCPAGHTVVPTTSPLFHRFFAGEQS